MNNMLFMSIIYILLMVLLVVVISICIKAILVIDEVNGKIDEVNEKVHSYDNIFSFIDDACFKILNLNEVVIDKLNAFWHFNSRRKKGRNE